MTPSYCPAICTSVVQNVTYAGDGGQLFQTHYPVTVLNAQYCDVLDSVQPGAIADGHWTSGSLCVAYWPARNVFYASGHTGTDFSSGSWVALTANMYSPAPDYSACCNITTAECLDNLEFMECHALGPGWRPHMGVSCALLTPPCGNPGACCDVHSGACIDEVLEANCLAIGRQFTSGAQCAELEPVCGNPGCCCDRPEPGELTDPFFAFEANCDGRFIAGAYPFCGDLDENGIVDLSDYGLFLDAFGKCAGQPGFIGAADLDGDGCVTLVDFQQWRNCYQFQGTGCEAEMFEPACGLQMISVDTSVGTAAPPPYLCGVYMLPCAPDTRPLYSDVSTLPTAHAIPGEVAVSPALNHRRIGSGWMSWSHGYTGDVYYSNGATTLTLTMPVATAVVYFYVEPNPFELKTFRVTVNGTYVSDTFTAHGSAGAAYVGICGNPVETVVLTCTSGVDFAIGEFAFDCGEDLGACCNEWSGVCTDHTLPSACVLVPHYRFGAFATCDELSPPCGEVRGACCYEIECVYQRPVECFEGGGQYAGDGVICDPNPCVCADFYIDAPGTWTGTTCGMGDDCALRAGAEVIFEVSIPYDGLWTFSLCGSDWDTYWFFGYDCCTYYWSQDDSTECGLAGHTQQQMTAGTYYIDLESYSASGCGNYNLVITEPPPPGHGACCDDETGDCVDDLLETDCATRFAAETLCEYLVPACGDLDPCADGTILAPGSWSGTTCAGGDDCALRTGEDRIIQVTIPADGDWSFALCGTSPIWDTYMFLGADCCTYTWYDDDGCGTVLSRIQVPGLAAGTYYVDIEPYSSSNCNNVTLEVATFEPEARAAVAGPAAPSTLQQLAPTRK